MKEVFTANKREAAGAKNGLSLGVKRGPHSVTVSPVGPLTEELAEALEQELTALLLTDGSITLDMSGAGNISYACLGAVLRAKQQAERVHRVSIRFTGVPAALTEELSKSGLETACLANGFFKKHGRWEAGGGYALISCCKEDRKLAAEAARRLSQSGIYSCCTWMQEEAPLTKSDLRTIRQCGVFILLLTDGECSRWSGRALLEAVCSAKPVLAVRAGECHLSDAMEALLSRYASAVTMDELKGAGEKLPRGMKSAETPNWQQLLGESTPGRGWFDAARGILYAGDGMQREENTNSDLTPIADPGTLRFILANGKACFFSCREDGTGRLITGSGLAVGRRSGWSGAAMQSEKISREHGVVRIGGSGAEFTASPVPAANGTYLNGKPLQAGKTYPLQAGDELCLAGICHMDYQEFSIYSLFNG